MNTLTPTRILLIEDEEDNAFIIRGLLARHGARFQLDWAETLAAGLAQLDADEIDLVLLDLNLPDSEGLATFRTLHARAPQLALVILTSNDDDAAALAAVQEGAQDYLLKFEINERVLVRALSYAVERKRAEQALRRAHDQLETQVRERTAELQSALVLSRENEGELARKHRELATLHTMTAAMNATLDLTEVLATLRQLLSEQMEIPGGQLFFYDPASDELVSQLNWGLPEHLQTHCQRIPATRCHAEVLSGQRALHWEDLREAPHLRELGLAEARPDWQSYLSLPLVVLGEVRGVLDLFSRKPRVFAAAQLPFFLALGQQIGVAINNAHSFGAEQEARKNSQRLSRLLVEAQETERRRIARELHDEAGQTLTGLKLLLEAVEPQVPPATKTSFQQARQTLQELSTQIRELSHALRPTMLDDLGLLPTLVTHCQRYTAQTGVRVALKHRNVENRRFAPEVETAAYRIVQEALTNVARYARTPVAAVRVIASEHTLWVQIADRGCGFDQQATAHAASNGLRGMRQRAVLLGGQFQLEAAPGAGVRLSASFPLYESGAAERQFPAPVQPEDEAQTPLARNATTEQ